MDIFFTDPTEIPLPPADVRIRELRAEPYPDGRRLRVTLEVDPFQKRPSAQVVIYDAAGEEMAETSIVESMTRKMEFTMHLRRASPGEAYRLEALLYYAEMEQPDSAEAPVKPIERNVVDQAACSFRLETPAGDQATK